MFSYRSLEIPKINDIRESHRTFDIGIICDAANPLAKPMNQAVDVMVGWLLQDGPIDVASTIEDTEIGVMTKNEPTNATGTVLVSTVTKKSRTRSKGLHFSVDASAA